MWLASQGKADRGSTFTEPLPVFTKVRRNKRFLNVSGFACYLHGKNNKGMYDILLSRNPRLGPLRADLPTLCLMLQCALSTVRLCVVHSLSGVSASCRPSMPCQTMRRRFARTAVGKSLLALTLAARLGPSTSSSSSSSSSLSTRFPLHPPFMIPATSTRAPRRLAATPPSANAAKPSPTRARRRARPTWHCGSEASAPTGVCCSIRAQGFSSSIHSGTHSPRKSVLTASNNDAASAGDRSPPGEPGLPASPITPPLAHEQLPEESIYLLDGTSMLFRAFYGRGAGG